MKKIIWVLVACSLHVGAAPLLMETFEEVDGVSAGSLDGQNGWVVSEGVASVQTVEAYHGVQALELLNGEVTHDLSSPHSAVWARFQTRISVAPDGVPPVPEENANVLFFINSNLNLTVYSNTTPVEVIAPIEINVWLRFDVYCDYAALTWDLSLNGSNVVAGLPMYSTNQTPAYVVISDNSSSGAYVDEVTVSDEELVSEAPDSDGDGVPDWWEQKYFNSPTGCDPEGVSQNDGLTHEQAYIAGVRPDVLDPFIISESATQRGLCWSSKPGRIYEVLWAPSLQSNFVAIAQIPATQTEYIDHAHTNDVSSFYRLMVEMAP